MDRLGDPDGGLQFIQIVSQLAGHPGFSADFARLHQSNDPTAPDPDMFLDRLLRASVSTANALAAD